MQKERSNIDGIGTGSDQINHQIQIASVNFFAPGVAVSVSCEIDGLKYVGLLLNENLPDQYAATLRSSPPNCPSQSALVLRVGHGAPEEVRRSFLEKQVAPVVSPSDATLVVEEQPEAVKKGKKRGSALWKGRVSCKAAVKRKQPSTLRKKGSSESSCGRGGLSATPVRELPDKPCDETETVLWTAKIKQVPNGGLRRSSRRAASNGLSTDPSAFTHLRVRRQELQCPNPEGLGLLRTCRVPEGIPPLPGRKRPLPRGQSGKPAALGPKDQNGPSDSTELSLGAIVWAKLGRSAWWPARIEKLISSSPQGTGHVVVHWCLAKTYSTIPLGMVEGFAEGFKARYRRHKAGHYRRAVKEAFRRCTAIHDAYQGSFDKFAASQKATDTT